MRLRPLFSAAFFSAVFFAAVLFLFAASGCSTNDNPAGTPESSVGEESLDLESSFGGYAMTDEDPGFGDDELLKNEDDGIEADDAIDADPVVVDMAATDSTDVYSVRLTWGMLEGDSSNTAITDWSGSISLNVDGAIVVERIIRFERDDFIVRPRTDRMVVDLVSQTGRHLDGVLITIFDPHGDVTAQDKSNVVNELTIALGDFEVTYLLTDLDSLDEIIDVDNLGNQFAIHAFQVTDFCPRGFLSGRWAPTSAGRGVFRGRWTSRYGLSHGWLKGHWGTNDNGKQIFYGKYIGQNGEFRGLLRGHWNHSPDRPGGSFNGRWHGEAGLVGGLRGVWSAPPHPANQPVMTESEEFNQRRPAGFFHGEWRANCDGSIDDDSSDFAPGRGSDQNPVEGAAGEA